MLLQVEKTCGHVLRVRMEGKCEKLDDLKGEIRGKLVPFLEPEDFFLETNNGKLLRDDEEMQNLLQAEVNTIRVVFRVLGGKGGFGSMLRAIGAQIENTTNRDACRDLSGRRLRDINEEQRLKKWFAKQAEREKEQQEAKKRKVEKLRQVADGPPLPKIDDQEFLQQREDIVDAVFDAVDEAFRDGTKDVDALKNNDSSSASSKYEVASKHHETEEEGKPCTSGSAADHVGTSSASSFATKQELKPIKKTMFDEDFDTSDSSCDEEHDTEPEEPLSKKPKLP